MLTQAGLHLEAQNVRYRLGELDLVMRDGPTLVFVEVRMRRSARFGGAVNSVDWRKRQRLLRAAQCYLLQRAGPTPACRFDVMAREGHGWTWVRDAFGVDPLL